jgi:hypothetical protein
MDNQNLSISEQKIQFQIPIPLDWTPPKYHFGQLVQQGWIYGLRYHPTYSALYNDGSGWSYEVVIDWNSEGYYLIPEEQIRPYDPKEAAKKLGHEIDNLHIRATALEQQLNQLVA